MTNKTDDRVLGRRNARDLSAEEVHKMLGQGEKLPPTLHFTSVIQPDE